MTQTATVGQSVGDSPRMREVGCSNPSATGVSVTVLGDDNYKRMPRVTVGVAR